MKSYKLTNDTAILAWAAGYDDPVCEEFESGGLQLTGYRVAGVPSQLRAANESELQRLLNIELLELVQALPVQGRKP